MRFRRVHVAMKGRRNMKKIQAALLLIGIIVAGPALAAKAICKNCTIYPDGSHVCETCTFEW